MQKMTPVLLLILDGVGYRLEKKDNAVAQAHTPNLDLLQQTYAFGTLNASEHSVGLPTGQFGNSEVGHLNIGSGRVVQQDISRIDLDIENGNIQHNLAIQTACKAAEGKTLHLMGLLSDGGVHSHENHLYALIKIASQYKIKDIAIHAFLDGRDTPPQSAETYLKRLETAIQPYSNVKIATVCGRYYAMDRDKRWERLEPAYLALVEGTAAYHADTALQALELAYARQEMDEFVKATIIGTPRPVQDGDAAIFINFRADRAKQLCSALTDPAFDAFEHRQPKFSAFVSLTSYGKDYKHAIAYDKQTIRNGFGEYLSSLGLNQLRIAETEKYPHVTYFFNGGEESVYPGEDRILVSSPKVATYDLQPEMSAEEVTQHILKAIYSNKYAAIICNYANGDMVGHTGNLQAAIQAVEKLDECVGRCVKAMQSIGGEVLITADHGNCELMQDYQHHQMHTQHTLNLVPFIYVGRPATIRQEGALRDIAPTLLAMMGLEQPKEMTGQSLIEWKNSTN